MLPAVPAREGGTRQWDQLWAGQRPQNLLGVLSHGTDLTVLVRKAHATASTRRATACDDARGRAPSPGSCTRSRELGFGQGRKGKAPLREALRMRKGGPRRVDLPIRLRKARQSASWMGSSAGIWENAATEGTETLQSFSPPRWASFPSNQPPPRENPVLILPPATAGSFLAELLRSPHAPWAKE